MRGNLRGAAIRLAIFTSVCALAIFSMVMVYGQLRFDNDRSYRAAFTNVSGLKDGDFVRIAGVEVGKVEHLAMNDAHEVLVDFTADETVVLTEGTRAVIRFDNLIGGRYLELQEGAGGLKRLAPGATIPPDRTAPALDLDAVIGGFRPLFRALEPDQVNALTGQLIAAVQGQGPTINSFLASTATLTSTLADRDQLIGQVITNLNTVLGSLADQSGQFAKAVDSLSQLVHGLAARKSDLVNAIAHTNAAASSVADALEEARPPLAETVHQTDRTAGNVLADHEYLDHIINTLPDTYQILGRQGIYGDFFTFYICDVLAKVNGKGGNPVFVKLVGQDTGRCAAK